MTQAKKISTLILTVIMMVSIIPAAVFAAGANGWVKDGNKWYYYADGQMVKEKWIKDGSKWYYLSENGVMAADTIVPDVGKKNLCYVDKSGAMVTKTGWRNVGQLFLSTPVDCWIYIQKGGKLALGWKKISGKWYYFDLIMASGKLVPNGLRYEQKYYFFNNDGSMKSNCWVKNARGEWYYLGKDGGSKTGWMKSGGKWYYLDEGAYGKCVVSSSMKIKDLWYSFDENGVCTNPQGSSDDPNKGKAIELPFVPADAL